MAGDKTAILIYSTNVKDAYTSMIQVQDPKDCGNRDKLKSLGDIRQIKGKPKLSMNQVEIPAGAPFRFAMGAFSVENEQLFNRRTYCIGTFEFQPQAGQTYFVSYEVQGKTKKNLSCWVQVFNVAGKEQKLVPETTTKELKGCSVMWP